MGLSRDMLDFIDRLLGIRQEKGPLKQEKFAFFSTGMPEETFGVVNFRGRESLSQCFQFEVNLISKTNGLDLDYLLTHEAVLLIHREDRLPAAFHGILNSFEQLHKAHGFTFYRATLLPKLWYLNLIHYNRVFLNRTLVQILEEVLGDMFPVVLDYEFRLQGDYSKPLEYVCQYQETHFEFLSRWLEREGLYYFFELTDQGEKLVITDSNLSHQDIPQEPVLRYREPSGLTGPWEEMVRSLNCRSTPVAKSVLLKDYNYRKPSLDLTGRGVIHSGAQWEVHYYGDHFQTPEEGDRLARIRSEELRCRQKTFNGKSTCPYLRPGFKFKLVDHYEEGFNGTYLITDVKHEGSQSGYLISGLKTETAGQDVNLHYRNTFTAIPIDLPFRPPRLTPKPKINGVINARIDAEGSGEYAELDQWGRYKVRLPFDLSGRQDGHASTWLRLAQPFVGQSQGMHFPLHKGTEVLLTFVDGDPDRPIIASAVPNIEHPSVVSSANHTMAGFMTSAGNQFTIQDRKGDRRIILSAAGGQSQIVCSEGNSGNIVQKSDFDSRSATYIHSTGGLTGSAVGALSQSMSAGAWLWSASSAVMNRYMAGVNATDQLGRQIGAYDDNEHYKGFNAALLTGLTLGPKILDHLFTVWLTNSLADALKKDNLYRRGSDFGPVMSLELDLNWGNKEVALSDRLKQIWKFNKNMVLKPIDYYVLGNTGSYGVTLFSHCTQDYESGFFTRTGAKIFDPRVMSNLHLSPGLPDILLASNKGYVDLMGYKGVNLYSSNKVSSESDQLSLLGRTSARLTGANSSVFAEKDKLTVEAKNFVIGNSFTDSVKVDGTKEITIGTKESKPGDHQTDKLFLYALDIGMGDKAITKNVKIGGNNLLLSGTDSISIGEKTLKINQKAKEVDIIGDSKVNLNSPQGIVNIIGKRRVKIVTDSLATISGDKIKIG